jgi:rhamnogalacturonan endolyase
LHQQAKDYLMRIVFINMLLLLCWLSAFSQKQPEKLTRGLIVLPAGGQSVYLSWRMFTADPADISFDIYKQQGQSPPVKVNNAPVLETTDFMDNHVDFSKNNTWFLKDKAGKMLAQYHIAANSAAHPYLSIPVKKPDGGSVEGEKFDYTANDASIGDLDGDGEYEIVLKWEPTNSKRPPQTGFTGNTIIDAYTLSGRLLWRIDLGKNIRSGAAVTNFLVADFDGDGKAELICKTGDGTRDGQGIYIGNKDADWRTKDKSGPTYGKVVNGPEYLTVFEGTTGKALASAEYIPTRYPLDGWGGTGGNGGNDNTGGRSDRYSACVAYLGGTNCSAVMIRGWYGRTVAAAWDFKDKKLTPRWVFDSALPEWKGYSGMANHSVTVADFDNDGFDEVCAGAMTIDHNGKGLFTTGLRHGDALHAGDLVPARPGLEVFGVHETEGPTEPLKTPGIALFDGRMGEILWSHYPAVDVGRGMAADIDPRYPGAECWGGAGGTRRSDTGEEIYEETPNSTNFAVWWDADPLRELLDKTVISKWDWENKETKVLLQAQDVSSNNGTKATPCFSGDILGDWREEVIWRSRDNSELRIYSTTIPAVNRMPALTHNAQYRMALAWQNVAYNQPQHPDFDMVERFDQTKPHNKPSAFDPALFPVYWTVEAEGGRSSVRHLHDTLEIAAPKGFTLWWNEKISGNVEIRYRACVMMDEGSAEDRLSDLNCFWMAKDPMYPDDIFKRRTWRNGVFGRCYSMRLYYLGYGGNSNTTTRFRRYDGNFEAFEKGAARPAILKEYTDKKHLLQPNHWYDIRIVCKDGRTQYYIDGELLVDFKDNEPYTDGWFGFRTTQSRVRLADFNIKL